MKTPITYITLFLICALALITYISISEDIEKNESDNPIITYSEEDNIKLNESKGSSSNSYSWIVGTWYVSTPYGTTSIRFGGNGSSGNVTELEDALNPYSAKHGTYYVEDNVLHYNLRGEPNGTTIEIHSGNRLYFGGGYYLKKAQ